jgi:hypothetical protein
MLSCSIGFDSLGSEPWNCSGADGCRLPSDKPLGLLFVSALLGNYGLLLFIFFWMLACIAQCFECFKRLA